MPREGPVRPRRAGPQGFHRYQPEVKLLQHTLLEAMGDGVFIAQDHRFVFANAALPAMLGHTPASFAGLPFSAVVAPDHLALWTQRFEARVGTGEEPRRHYELQFLARDGQALWVELRANRMLHEGRPAVLGIVRDISERKGVDAALHAERQLTQAMLDGLAAHVCVLDEHGTLVACNAAWRSFASRQGVPGILVNEGANYRGATCCRPAPRAGARERSVRDDLQRRHG
jgi:two-component system, sensor histidine kinase and response regulator